MSLNGTVHQSGQHIVALPATTIAAAVAAVGTTAITRLSGAKYLVAQAKFLYGAGGTNVNVYVQTSLDQGVTWVDIMNFLFTTAAATKISAVVATTALAAVIAPSDGALTSNTILSGLLGERFRIKWVTTGTYSGATSLQVDLIVKG